MEAYTSQFLAKEPVASRHIGTLLINPLVLCATATCFEYLDLLSRNVSVQIRATYKCHTCNTRFLFSRFTASSRHIDSILLGGEVHVLDVCLCCHIRHVEAHPSCLPHCMSSWPPLTAQPENVLIDAQVSSVSREVTYFLYLTKCKQQLVQHVIDNHTSTL